MMKFKILATLFLFMGSLLIFAISDADAARLGGGRSFGSKPSMQRSTTTPTQQKPALAQAAPGAAAQKSGLFGGMGGMLGGLLAGTLIGSLLFGGGFSGGGIMDLLLIALVAFVAFKLFARFKANRSSEPATAAAGGHGGSMYQQQEPPAMQRQSADMWGGLQNKGAEAQTAPAEPSVPEGFDTEEFLRGAKMAFTRLQSSWDKRDLADIEQFASPAVMEEVRAQYAAEPAPGKTELLLVNAQLLSVTEEEGNQWGTVFFDVLLREAPGRDTTQVREVWHFVRPLNGDGSWKLDGIQQVE